MEDFWKIRDASLRALAESPFGEPVSVLVTPELPPRRIKLESKNGLDTPLKAPAAVEGEPVAEEVVRALSGFLADLTGEVPLWLPAARCFVVTVLPEQLILLIARPDVAAVWLNRTLRRDDLP